MSVPEAPRLSIVIVCHGKRAVTERCLETLDAAFGDRVGADVELVLVDNASPDDTRELLADWSDRAQVILLDENRNYAGGNNVGARAASGEVLVLLNNDTEVGEGVLDALASEALDPTVGVAGMRLLYPDGTIQHGGCAWWRAPDGHVRPFHLFRHEAGDHPSALSVFDCDFVTAACIAVRRELFLSLGGFDEEFVNGWEDVDLCVRARLAGFRVVYRGDLALIHAEAATRTSGHDETPNEKIFFARYGHALEEDTERLAAQFDASGPTFGWLSHPARQPGGAAVSVEGEVTGFAPESFEARALLAGFEASGLDPAARDWQPVAVTPRLTQQEWDPVVRGRQRPKRIGSLVVQTPVGQMGVLDRSVSGIVRVASMPSVDVSFASSVWASSASLADELIAEGLSADRVEVVPPLLPSLPVGPGGGGVLAVLPSHDLDHCRQVLAALAGLDVCARVLPTVATEIVASLVASLLPSAEVLAPVASELRFAALCCESDVVACADSRDPFERRALLAAGTGAAAIHLPEGTAAAVLGPELSFSGHWSAALEAALASRSSRGERATLVQSTCSIDSAAAWLPDLVERATRAGEFTRL
ncbi:MAG TPA: glycosyltransferase family 2 protein [Thermoleophilaceae bacterium]|nr:glycosyltransferase family 2 protein [Thermoleophilaceae bacterium]